MPLSTGPSLSGDVRPVLRDSGDHPRVGLSRVGVNQRELVAVHQQRQYHLKESRIVVGPGENKPRSLSRILILRFWTESLGSSLLRNI